MSADLYDITILGAGPVGMYAAYYAGFRKLKTKVIDSLEEVGGQITGLYPDKNIYDVAGFPSILGKDLVRNLEQQMMQFQPAVHLGEQAQKLARTDEGWRLTTDKGEHRTKTILITTGLGVMNPRKLENAAFAAYEGKGLAYVMKDPKSLAGKRVMLVGGGDSAVDWANHLAPVAAAVYVVHRRDAFRAHEESVEQMRKHAQIKTPGHVQAIHGGDRITAVTIGYGGKQPDETVEVDALFGFLGFVTSPGPIADWGLELHDGDVRVNQHTETNLPGVFAAGDCATYEGKVKLISVGFGEAAIAVNHAAHVIDPSKRVFPGHSSNSK